MTIAQTPRTLEIAERLIMLPGSEKLRMRVTSDDPAALDALFAVAAHAEWIGSDHHRLADYVLSDEGAADLYEHTRASIKAREKCRVGDHDEYEWAIGFFSIKARAHFIAWARWIGAAVSEDGIAIPSRIAREIAALMRP